MTSENEPPPAEKEETPEIDEDILDKEDYTDSPLDMDIENVIAQYSGKEPIKAETHTKRPD